MFPLQNLARKEFNTNEPVIDAILAKRVDAREWYYSLTDGHRDKTYAQKYVINFGVLSLSLRLSLSICDSTFLLNI